MKINNKIQISLMDLPGQFKLIEKRVMPEIKRVLESGRYIMGPEVTKLEENFAKYCGAKYCIGTSSGTESLILGLRALGVGPGDEVITVPNTFTATAEAIVVVGAKAVFCDIDPETMNMDPKELKKKITSKTKAVIVVHLHGNLTDMDEIYKITKTKKIAVIEDAAQAHGALYKGKKVGGLKSEITCFSFHPVKNMGAFGDAGGITTNSLKINNAVRLLINHGRKNHLIHSVVGNTGRLDAIQAVVLNIKLQLLDDWIEKKRELVEYYKKNLPKDLGMIKETPNSSSAHHVFAVLAKSRDKLSDYLKDQGIETGKHYPVSLHLQPAYKFLGYKKGDFPNSEQYTNSTLSLPLYPHMRKSEIDYVISHICHFYGDS